jgi:hypothetical protein
MTKRDRRSRALVLVSFSGVIRSGGKQFSAVEIPHLSAGRAELGARFFRGLAYISAVPVAVVRIGAVPFPLQIDVVQGHAQNPSASTVQQRSRAPDDIVGGFEGTRDQNSCVS